MALTLCISLLSRLPYVCTLSPLYSPSVPSLDLLEAPMLLPLDLFTALLSLLSYGSTLGILSLAYLVIFGSFLSSYLPDPP